MRQTALFLAAGVLFATPLLGPWEAVEVWAGNKQMVEERIDELDQLNKQAVRQVPGIPRDGRVHLKTRVFQQDGEIRFDTYHLEITPAPKEGQDYETNKDGKHTP